MPECRNVPLAILSLAYLVLSFKNAGDKIASGTSEPAVYPKSK
jgi:hypothetical protein